MRYLIDTNIFIYIATDPGLLSRDVRALLEYDAEVYMSAESVAELVIAYRNRGFNYRLWKNENDMVRSITNDYHITILPVDVSVVERFASLSLNVREGHKDHFDHIIISHALALRMPLISSDRKFEFYRAQGLDLIRNEK